MINDFIDHVVFNFYWKFLYNLRLHDIKPLTTNMAYATCLSLSFFSRATRNNMIIIDEDYPLFGIDDWCNPKSGRRKTEVDNLIPWNYVHTPKKVGVPRIHCGPMEIVVPRPIRPPPMVRPLDFPTFMEPGTFQPPSIKEAHREYKKKRPNWMSSNFLKEINLYE